MSNAVGYRSLQVNGRYIRGYGLPDFSAVTVSNPSTSATGGAGQAGTSGGSTALAFSVGDVVRFTGRKHYTNANAASGPACKPGTAKVTAISKGTKHPYHLIAQSGGGSNVYGWVDAADVQASGTASSVKTHTVVKGDTLSAIAKKYGTTVAQIVAANKAKYSKITANYIVTGWVLTIPQ